MYINGQPTPMTEYTLGDLTRLMRHDLDVETYQLMQEKQSGVCWICGEPPLQKRALAVDHCHTTGVIRGLLCTRCNIGLGMFKDNENRLLKAVEYLKCSR